MYINVQAESQTSEVRTSRALFKEFFFLKSSQMIQMLHTHRFEFGK